MTVRIEPLAAADVERVAELESQLFDGDSPWPVDAFRRVVGRSDSHYVTARIDDKIVGYAGLVLLGTPVNPESEIHTIAVDPAHQRRGIGAALLAELLARAGAHGGPVFLEVRTDNEPALTMYVRNGFQILSTRKGYYQHAGADAYTMKRAAS